MAEYIIKETSLIELADIIRDKFEDVDNCVLLISNADLVNMFKLPEGITSIAPFIFDGCTNLALTSIPKGVTSIGVRAFRACNNLALTSIPESVTSIHDRAFESCTSLTTLTFQGTPTTISTSAFNDCPKLRIINVPWSEGAVANAPWGATNATINYNYVEA